MMLVVELPVRDLTADDLPEIGWSGGPLHPRYVAEALQRRATSGDVEYLAVCGTRRITRSRSAASTSRSQRAPERCTSWEVETAAGEREVHHAQCVRMRKQLSDDAPVADGVPR